MFRTFVPTLRVHERAPFQWLQAVLSPGLSTGLTFVTFTDTVHNMYTDTVTLGLSEPCFMGNRFTVGVDTLSQHFRRCHCDRCSLYFTAPSTRNSEPRVKKYVSHSAARPLCTVLAALAGRVYGAAAAGGARASL